MALRRSNVEADVEHVAVLYGVGLALEPLPPAARCFRVRAGVREIARMAHVRLHLGDGGSLSFAGLAASQLAAEDVVWMCVRRQMI